MSANKRAGSSCPWRPEAGGDGAEPSDTGWPGVKHQRLLLLLCVSAEEGLTPGRVRTKSLSVSLSMQGHETLPPRQDSDLSSKDYATPFQPLVCTFFFFQMDVKIKKKNHQEERC